MPSVARQQIGITTIYVTHDQSDALEIFDLIAAIDQGCVVRIEPPRDIDCRSRNTLMAYTLV